MLCRMRHRSIPLGFVVALFALVVCVQAFAADGYTAGVASVDITPDYAVRLSGFGFRREESEGVRQHIHAKALALAGHGQPTAVLITVDNLGIPDSMTKEIGQRLTRKASLDPTRLSISASHTHT